MTESSTSTRSRKRWHVPLPVALTAGIGGLVLIAVLGVAYLGFWTARQTTVELLSEQADTIIGSMERVFERQLEPVVDQARWIASQVRLGQLTLNDPVQLDIFVRGAIAATPALWAIALVDTEGQGRLYERTFPEAQSLDLSSEPEFERIVGESRTRPEPRWGPPRWYADDEIAIVYLRTPLFVGDRLVGLLYQAVTIHDLSRSVMAHTVDEHFVPFAIYDHAWVLVHPLLSERGLGGSSDVPLPALGTFADGRLVGLSEPSAVDLDLLDQSQNVHGRVVDVGDQSFIFLTKTFDRYADKPLTIGVYFPSDVLRDSALGRLMWTGFFAFGVLVVSVIAALVLARAIGRPVLTLTGAMSGIGSGHLGQARHLGSSPIRELDRAFEAFNAMVEGLRERRLIRGILGTYVPEDVAASLIRGKGALEPVSTEATVLFVDLVGFTSAVENIRPPDVIALLNSWFSAAAEILERHGGVITQFQGDAILAVFNVPASDPEHARRAVEAALAMRRAAEEQTFAGRRLGIRIGITTGDLVAGSVGAAERRSYTVHGDVVNLAARLERMNKQTGTVILVDEETARRAAALSFERVGMVEVRGKSAPVTVFTPQP